MVGVWVRSRAFDPNFGRSLAATPPSTEYAEYSQRAAAVATAGGGCGCAAAARSDRPTRRLTSSRQLTRLSRAGVRPRHLLQQVAARASSRPGRRRLRRETRLPAAVSQDTTRWRTTRLPRRSDLHAMRRARRAQQDRTGRRGSACCGGSDCTPHCRGVGCSAVPVRTASSTLYSGARASARRGMYRRRTAAESQGNRSRPCAR